MNTENEYSNISPKAETKVNEHTVVFEYINLSTLFQY